MSPLQTQPSIVCLEGNPVLKALLQSLHGAADVDEFTKPTLVEQRAQEAIVASSLRLPPSAACFLCCSVLVGPLLPNPHHYGMFRC
ncbi:hypothetical protein TNCV_4902681 [Trichonephila clavipes]|nr:hypothetical protein TNCV_4902681 [Trichonephila clavipes]